jgi:hypothetical protein
MVVVVRDTVSTGAPSVGSFCLTLQPLRFPPRLMGSCGHPVNGWMMVSRPLHPHPIRWRQCQGLLSLYSRYLVAPPSPREGRALTITSGQDEICIPLLSINGGWCHLHRRLLSTRRSSHDDCRICEFSVSVLSESLSPGFLPPSRALQSSPVCLCGVIWLVPVESWV